MKLTIALYTALYTVGFVLAPAVGFAADQSAHQQNKTTASERSYPYPDWPAIAKTAPQKSTDQEKGAEQSGSSDNKFEPSILEKGPNDAIPF